MRCRSRGIALIMTLGFTVVILMMLTATLTSTHGANIFSQDYHRKASALYAAESGLAAVQAKLEEDSDWEIGFDNEPTQFGTGSFTVRFGPSVNNLNNATPAVGPYGPVAPQTAYIRVEGHAMGRTEVIECVLGRKAEDFVHMAMVATGKIVLAGGVNIAGRVSSEELGMAEADVVSNYDREAPWGNGVRPVNWMGSASAEDQVRGTIRSASPSDGAISSNLVGIADQALTDQAPVSVKNVNIKRAIDSKSGVSASVPSSPIAPLNGEYYESGDKTVTGDLVLNNANLYINGDLTVLGSIRGAGGVYVAGDTRLWGDSQVIANEEGIVLYSQGNVHLQGFNGTAWMDVVAPSRGRGLEWEQTKQNFQVLQDYLNAYSEGDDSALRVPAGTPPAGTLAASLSYWGSDAGIAIANLSFPLNDDFRPPGITENDLLWKMLEVIEEEPPGRTRDFMFNKFAELREPGLFGGDDPVGGALGIHRSGGNAEQVTDFLDSGQTQETGLQLEFFLTAAVLHGETMGQGNFNAYDGLQHNALHQAVLKHTHWLDLYSYDSLGTSYFQGSVYTRGAIYASNEVTIIGSLSAVRDPKEPNTPWNPNYGATGDNSVTLYPGDVYLGRGTRILHVERLEPGLRFASPPVGVSYWLR